MLHTEVLAPLASQVELGSTMLEIGPGPGAATDWLRHRVNAITLLEIEDAAAGALSSRFEGANVEVRQGDATAMPFEDACFDSVGAFTMLHHVPTVAMQDAMLREVLRVLRPGGPFIGSDSLPSNDLHLFHEGDTYNPVDPASFLVRLQTLGFEKITIAVDYGLRFIAHKPDPSSARE